MGDRRFDHRSKDTFKKDIKFGTRIETYFWNQWLKVAENAGFKIEDYGDNGVDNSGEFIPSGKCTAGADYIVTMSYKGHKCEDLPLEVKWVPTAGKLTLKENDLKAYQKEEAAILFIYNSVKCDVILKKPKDYDFDKHIKRIEGKANDIKWGIMMPEKVSELLTTYQDRFEPIWYMGNKSGIIIKQEEFSKFFNIHDWKNI